MEKPIIDLQELLEEVQDTLAVKVLAFPKDVFVLAVAPSRATVKRVVAQNNGIFRFTVLDADYLFYDVVPRAIDVHCVYHKIRFVVHFLSPP